MIHFDWRGSASRSPVVSRHFKKGAKKKIEIMAKLGVPNFNKAGGGLRSEIRANVKLALKRCFNSPNTATLHNLLAYLSLQKRTDSTQAPSRALVSLYL